jgi:hypothetical protein
VLRRLVTALAVACLALASCTDAPRRTHPLDDTLVWKRYRSLPDARAMVLAGDPTSAVWVVGMAGGEDSPAEAERSARAECERQRNRRRIVDPCRPYASGRRVVWGAGGP